MNIDPAITYFDHYARCNDLSVSGRRFLWPYYRKLYLRSLPTNRETRILDFGCGAGMLLEWLKSEGYTNVEGVDCDAGQVSFAEGLGVKAYFASDSGLWLRKAGRYDVIFMSDVLEHIPQGDDLHLLHNLNQALNPGGLAIIKVPNANAEFGARARYIDSTHQRVYTELSLHYDLQRSGFQQILIVPDDLWSPRNAKELLILVLRFVFRSVRRLQALCEFGMPARHMPLSQNLIAICRKPVG
jgi:SAM-dependent methyltransferase